MSRFVRSEFWVSSLIILYCFSNCLISVVVVPEPLAILLNLEVCFSRISGLLISSSVMELMACCHFFIFSSWLPSISSGILSLLAPRPGIMSIIFEKLPTFPICWSCSWKSLRLRLPCSSFSFRSFCLVGSTADSTFSNKPSKSPSPNIREMKDFGLKVSRSFIFSPVPIK